LFKDDPDLAIILLDGVFEERSFKRQPDGIHLLTTHCVQLSRCGQADGVAGTDLDGDLVKTRIGEGDLVSCRKTQQLQAGRYRGDLRS
jgi:hypothetical protein